MNSTVFQGSPQDSDLSNLAACPLPMGRYDRVVLGHGSGGRLSADLLRDLFLPAFHDPTLHQLEDQATVSVGSVRLAFTTDGFVVRPLFFPGGDIGRLAICGTVNDLAVGGAQPQFLSAAFILEEGLPLSDLKRIVTSMRQACEEAGVALVTGDTKVVDRGKGDKVFITTSAIGCVPSHLSLSIRNARPGDQIILSGTIGDHGIAVMSIREGLEFETELRSDCVPLNGLTAMMLESCPELRCMRDPTRGGLAATLHEIASASQVGVRIHERRIPIRPEVRGACEILGLDPTYVANEGKLVAVVPEEFAQPLLDRMRTHDYGKEAAIIGEVVKDHAGMVTMKSVAGGERIVTQLTGEQLPRIC
jgi:hydrogenase expression/formation protein HypE